jgi:hypothetical protein
VIRKAVDLEADLRSCERKLVNRIRGDWAIPFGTREVRLQIEYQDGVPVLVRVCWIQ